MHFLLRSLFLLGIFFLLGLTGYLNTLREDDSAAYLISFVSTRTGTREVYTMTSVGSGIRQLTHRNIGMYSDLRWDEEQHCIRGNQWPESFCAKLYGDVQVTSLEYNLPPPQEPPQVSGLNYSAYWLIDDQQWFILGANEGLYRVQVGGSELVQLSETPTTSVGYIEQTQQILFQTAEGWSIISFDGQNKRFLTEYNIANYNIQISPDGQWLWLEFNDPNRPSLSLVINPSEDYSFYADNYGYDMFWTSDSRYLLFTENQQAYSFDLLEKTKYPLIKVQAGYDQFKIYGESPDGKWLLMQVNEDIYVLRPDGSAMKNISNQPLTKQSATSSGYTYQRKNRNAQWSPDGQWIVFQSELQYGTSDIYRVRPDGTDMQNLTHNPNWDVTPSWLPPIEKAWHPDHVLGGGLGLLGLGIIFLQLSKKYNQSHE